MNRASHKLLLVVPISGLDPSRQGQPRNTSSIKNTEGSVEILPAQLDQRTGQNFPDPEAESEALAVLNHAYATLRRLRMGVASSGPRSRPAEYSLVESGLVTGPNSLQTVASRQDWDSTANDSVA